MKSRFLLYLAALALLTGLFVWSAIAQSRANLAHDPSSMAWVSFLPFIVPAFLVYALAVVAPLAIVVEAALWIYRKLTGEA
jgi:hypothetical protein